MQHALACETFDGSDFRSVRLNCQDRACLDGSPVQLNRAGAALAGIAADVSPCQIQLFPQEINQQSPWLHNNLMLPTVDGDPYRNSGKLDLSNHAQLASICASQNLSLKLFSSNRQTLIKKFSFDCHTPTSSQSQYLSEKSSRSLVTNARNLFFQQVTSRLTNTMGFHYDRPMLRRGSIFRRACRVTVLMMVFAAVGAEPAHANHYLSKPGEPPSAVLSATFA